MQFIHKARKAFEAAAPVIALGAAWPAWANEAESPLGRDMLAWGVTTSASVQLVPAEDHPADILFVNRLTHGNALEMAFVLEIEGLTVDVEVSNGIGEQPDIVVVRPPPGFVAVPSTIKVEEGETGLIQILPALLS
jgi:hypothetical protein